MNSSARILLGLALLLAAASAAGQTVDHYDLAPSVMRANGQSIYPAGVSDPSRANPPGPSPENAVPLPPTPATPGTSTAVSPAASPAGTLPASPPANPTPTVSPVWSPHGPASLSNSASNSVPGTAPSVWNSSSAVQTQVYAPAAMESEAGSPAHASWYVREEYYHWNERVGGSDFVNEDGALTTVGYTRQIGIERFRAELFGGTVHYESFGEDSNTGYLGLRGEYELVLAPAAWEGRAAFLAGVGSRFWIRDLHDDPGNGMSGYQETWWTIYPYLGIETHLHLGSDLELYSESRVGATVMTYQFCSTNTVVCVNPADPWNPQYPPFIAERPLWPKPGIVANTEIGLRGPRFFVAARFEVMSWSPSSDEVSVVQDVNQPNSVLFTAGGRFGFMF